MSHVHSEEEFKSVIAEGVSLINSLKQELEFFKISDMIGRRIISHLLPNTGDKTELILEAQDDLNMAITPNCTTRQKLTVIKSADGLDLEIESIE